MDKKRLKVGIIGCGGIANGKHMPSIKAVNMADMVAFCDLIEERCLLYTSPSPRDISGSRMPSSA